METFYTVMLSRPHKRTWVQDQGLYAGSRDQDQYSTPRSTGQDQSLHL